MMRILTALSTCALLLGATVTDLPAALTEVRSIDGSGNNIASPEFGQAGEQLLRGTNGYNDGLSVPRGGSPVSSLPSPRAISNAASAQTGNLFNNRGMTDWVWQWGQFLDHDIDLTPGATPSVSFNIDVPTGDAQFDPFNTGTQKIFLNRSTFEVDGDGIRQQTNEITAFIDGSNVYGSDITRANELRTLAGDGKLKTSTGDLLPFNTAGLPNDNGPVGGANGDFFLAGDVRANEQVGLTATHTLFVREHNRLAELIRTNNPSLTGDEIYEKARKIVGAEIQAITYNEFLPALLGDAAASLDTSLASYDANINPQIANEFSTATYRFGHSMLAPDLQLVNNAGTNVGLLALRNAFFDPTILGSDPAKLDLLIKGLASQAAQEIDAHVVDDVRNFLFGPPGAGGFDLASLNIQRGRDHGLGTYNEYRQHLGLDAKTDFFDPGDGTGITTDAALASALAGVYGDIDDVDIWIGGLSEDHLANSSVGELLAASLTDQFLRLRDGDRFFFTFDADLLHPDILAVIDLNNFRLSELIRNNTNITNIQNNVFFIAVPEPATVALGLLSITVLGVRRRRRRGA